MASAADDERAMGWISRRIAGFITFAIVSSVLAAWALSRGYITGEPTLGTTWGLAILGIAFLASVAVTHHMKIRDQARKAWEDYQRAWQEYYARMQAAQVHAAQVRASQIQAAQMRAVQSRR